MGLDYRQIGIDALKERLEKQKQARRDINRKIRTTEMRLEALGE